MNHHSLVIFRCAHCGSGVHPGDEVHLRDLDDIVCPRCADDWSDALRALTFWLTAFSQPVEEQT